MLFSGISCEFVDRSPLDPGGILKPGPQLRSSGSATSGFCLCLALRPAGLAFSSGLAWLIGCPGGAEGFRILSKIGRSFCLALFRRDPRVAI